MPCAIPNAAELKEKERSRSLSMAMLCWGQHVFLSLRGFPQIRRMITRNYRTAKAAAEETAECPPTSDKDLRRQYETTDS